MRFIIGGIAIAAVLLLYAAIDCAMSEPTRARVMSKPLWLIVIIVVPVIGPLLWLFVGRSARRQQGQAPDDSEAYLREVGERQHREREARDTDDRIAQLEAELRRLDEEEANDPRYRNRGDRGAELGGTDPDANPDAPQR